MGCDFFGGDVGRVGMEVLSGLGGCCLDCCSPVAKCPKDGVGNGRIWDLGRWAVISLAAMLGVGMEVLSGLGIV